MADSKISTYLTRILSSVYGKDVRQAIHDAISQCYSDVSNPTLNTEALESIIQAKIDSGELANMSIGEGAVTEEKIAGSAVTTAKIADGSVTASKIGSDVKYNIGKRVVGDGITSIVRMAQAEYDSLSVKDPDTIYIIDSNAPYVVIGGDAHFIAYFMWSKEHSYELAMRIPQIANYDVYLHSNLGGKYPVFKNSGVDGSSTYIQTDIASDAYNDFGIIRTPSVYHVYKRTPTELYLDGVKVKDVSVGTKTINNILGVGNCTGSNTGVFEFFGLKVYDADNNLIHHLAPAKDGNTVCLIDKMTGSYFYNQGSTAVTYGRGEV